jgi:hypothetical protein
VPDIPLAFNSRKLVKKWISGKDRMLLLDTSNERNERKLSRR